MKHKTGKHTHKRARNIFLVSLLITGTTASVIACGWMGTGSSVRFNAFQDEYEMGRLPPLPTLADKLNDGRAYWDSDYEMGEKLSDEVHSLWDQADSAEKSGNLNGSRELLRQYLQQTKIQRRVWFDCSDCQKRRNSAVDRLDALSALDRGSSQLHVQAYLKARHAYDWDKPSAEIAAALQEIKKDPNLRDNAAYLLAAELHRRKEFKQASQAFTAVAKQYPRSEKREASLFMAAVAMMKTSSTYSETSGDEAHLHEDHDSEPCVLFADKSWHDAFAAFKKYLGEYPRGRYANDARGWLAYLHLRKNDRASALIEYYGLLANKTDENARIEAAYSLTFVRHHATDSEMLRVEREVERQPDVALVYAYHNIYNYSIDPGPPFPAYEEVKDHKGEVNYELSRIRNTEIEEQWEQQRSLAEKKELSRVLTFTERLIRRYPNLRPGGAFALRAAQASLELGNNENAVRFARRAMQSQLAEKERAEALWTCGVAEHRLEQYESARKDFTALIREYPRSELLEGARRHLAMIAEDAGDIESALQQYLELDFNLDVAYFVDVLMTPEQLAEFVQSHPDSPKLNEFTYALALRYLRDNRWQDARETLSQVRATGTRDYNIYGTKDCQGTVAECNDPKRDSSNRITLITPRIILRDVQTANDLESLEKAVNQAVGDEEKAEALYQFASYQYEASSLLFYNPIAWGGGWYEGEGRYWNLSELSSKGAYRINNEYEVLFAYMQNHDTLARALKTYLEIVSKYPATRAARDALYTAAVCHERLANYNPYWREMYGNGIHAGSRMVTYLDVKAAYPNYQLPRGTYGWQPSNRTVNGKPSWAPPPKPAPRPTRMDRVEALLLKLGNSLEVFWRDVASRWVMGALIFVALWFTWRIAARNRSVLYKKVARLRLRKDKQEVSYPWTTLFLIDTAEGGRREKLHQFLQNTRSEFSELMRDRKSRTLLLKNIVSHSLFAWLLMHLFWTLSGN